MFVLDLARARVRPVSRLIAWATSRANAAKRPPTSLDARGVAHAVKRPSGIQTLLSQLNALQRLLIADVEPSVGEGR